MDLLGKFVVLLVGLALTAFGWTRSELAKHVPEKPVVVDLASLQKGDKPAGLHLQLGDHVRIYDRAFPLVKNWSGPGRPGPNIPVDYTYYPVVTADHPMATGSQEPGKKPAPFSILVKSKTFAYGSDVPAQSQPSNALTGIAWNRVSGLTSDDELVIARGYPWVNVADLYILEEGQKPPRRAQALGAMAGGGVCILVALAFLVKGLRE